MRNHRIAPAPFCIVERTVGRLDQAGRRLTRLRHMRLDADADGYDAARRLHVRHQQLFDRTARFFGKRNRMLDIEPRQQQGEFLAAIPGNDQSLVERDKRQGFADRPQTGVTLDVAIAIVEKLEVIDVDHDQSERLAQFVRMPPGMIQFAIKAAPVGKAGK